jgi:VIT1/CCC1 family predicted Fe2+/Mn2+ transporter
MSKLKVERKRREIERKSKIRELVFGVQDGVLSTVGLLAGMQGATADNHTVMIAGFAAMFAGAVSMSAGAYLSSKAEKEIFEKELREGVQYYDDEPYVAQESLLKALSQEGLSRDLAYRIVKLLHNDKRVFVKTFQEKVLGLGSADIEKPVLSAVVMGISFSLGALVPLFPYFFIFGSVAMYISVTLSALTLFGVGAFKGKLANISPLKSGLEFFFIAVGAGIIGFIIGKITGISV